MIYVLRLICGFNFLFSRNLNAKSLVQETFSARRFVELVSLSAASAPLHLRLPQELHPECPQQEEEEDERRWGRVPGSRRGGTRGNVN